MASSHLYHKEDVATGYSKMEKITGHKENYRHPADKARDIADTSYYENEHLDPLPRPTTEEVGS